MKNELDYPTLKNVIRRMMLHYPHAEPNEETVEALASGLVAVIEVSNHRPEKYAHEPWLQQPAKYHAEHAAAHAAHAVNSLTPECEEEFPWLSDLQQPEIAHACMRSMLCMYQQKKGRLV